MKKFKEVELSSVQSMWFPGVRYMIVMNIPRGSERSGNGSFLTVCAVYPDGTFGDYAAEFECDQEDEAKAYARKQDDAAHLDLMERKYGTQ